MKKNIMTIAYSVLLVTLVLMNYQIKAMKPDNAKTFNGSIHLRSLQQTYECVINTKIHQRTNEISDKNIIGDISDKDLITQKSMYESFQKTLNDPTNNFCLIHYGKEVENREDKYVTVTSIRSAPHAIIINKNKIVHKQIIIYMQKNKLSAS